MVSRPADARALALIQRVVLLGLLAGVTISWPLWTLARELPAIPWITGFPALGAPLDRIIYAVWIGLILVSCVRPESIAPLAGVVVIGAGLMLQDIARMQPWAYLYLLLLTMQLAHRVVAARGAGRSNSEVATLRATVLLVSAVYLFSGLHKVSVTYVPLVFAELVKPVAAAVGLSDSAVNAMGYASIVMETLIGLGFLWRRTRWMAALIATVMHVGILISLGPLGRNENAVVWPWNLVMVALIWILVRRDRRVAAPTGDATPTPVWSRLVRGVVCIVACVLPLLGLADRWPAYMSWAMYVGREPQVLLTMSDAVARRAGAPSDVLKIERLFNSESARHAVVMLDWISDQTNARPFPEQWYEELIARKVLLRFQSIEGVQVITITRSHRWTGKDELRSVPAVEFLSDRGR